MRLSMMLLALLALGVPVSHADRTTFEDTKTQVAPLLDKAPVIDGVIDPTEWQRASTWKITVDPTLSDGIRGGALGDGAANPPVDNNDLSFQVYAGYDQNNLYVSVRVNVDIIKMYSSEAE